MCLPETFVEGLKRDIFSKFTHFIAPAIQLSSTGRRSGGLLLFVENAFVDRVQMIELGMKTDYHQTVDPSSFSFFLFFFLSTPTDIFSFACIRLPWYHHCTQVQNLTMVLQL